CTRSLQDQLVERDLPALLEALGVSLPFASLKGKQNYLCPRELDLEDSPAAEDRETLEALRRWAAIDAEGDLDRFEPPDADSFRRMRPRIATDAAACTAATCRRGRECFWVRARREAANARIIVVNHALLALAAESEGLLPEFDALIVDEAHRLEGVLLAQLERSVSRHRFEELFRVLGSARAPSRGRRRAGGEAGGLLARANGYAAPLLSRAGEESVPDQIARLARRVPEAREDVERLFEHVAADAAPSGLYAQRRRYRNPVELLGGHFESLETCLRHCTECARALHRLGEIVGGLDTPRALELAAECEQVSGRFDSLGMDLDDLAHAARPGWVYWRSSGGRGIELHGAPMTAGEHARRLVLSRARATVLTSATLSAAGDFEFLAGRLGLGEHHGAPYEAIALPSPFPLERQMRAHVYEGGSDEAEAVCDVVVELSRGRRNQLVLFTAHERLRRARARLLSRLGDPSRLIAQEWDGPAGLISERFRAARGAILLGVQSLWEGVDFPGEALEIVVVAKLPFAVPDDPRVEARAEHLRGQDIDPFRADALPEAVLRFRQGVGRLIRRADDRGIVVVCDPRLATASYRSAFLSALPVPVTRWRDAKAMADDAERFLTESLVLEEEP
ncbi:MAG TPA: ATP-dependent DNA helicase, partial [Candidatus Udaeobacter sp.]|nr:ATP-dependent DNA helicase [Candidatus Udaeobacter sp.]